MTKPLRVPVSVAAKRGVSWLNDTAAEQRVILTRFGQPHAVVDTAERLDADAAMIRTASRQVVETYANTAASRTTTRPLDEVCAKLGIDPDQVRAKAAHLNGR